MTATPTKSQVLRAARQALEMLERAKGGADPLGTLEGTGPVNEWVAIGYAKSALQERWASRINQTESPSETALCFSPKMLRRPHNDSSWRAHVWWTAHN